MVEKQRKLTSQCQWQLVEDLKLVFENLKVEPIVVVIKSYPHSQVIW
jgi:hypothetical protein